jgi:hypothetical protein
MMMRSVAVALILGLASASSAQAGAWLREKGKGFASTSVQTTKDDGNSISLYVEYGLSKNMTAGIDITYDSDLMNYLSGTGPLVDRVEDLPVGSGIGFLRFPIGPTDRPNKWAFHLGYGARYYNGLILRAREIGFSWGRGFQIGDRYGWMNVDTSYNTSEEPAETRLKIDGTIGFGFSERVKTMVQLFNTREGENTYSKFAPSVLFSFGKGNTTIQIGSEVLLTGEGGTSIKIGVWQNF